VTKTNVEFEIEGILKRKPRVFVLFYASWCPFSQRFLPIFAKYAEGSHECLRVVIDDKPSLCEKYSVDFVPSVLLFEQGAVTKRLDGEPRVGLDEAELINLLAES
jgi:thioredoxin 1